MFRWLQEFPQPSEHTTAAFVVAPTLAHFLSRIIAGAVAIGNSSDAASVTNFAGCGTDEEDLALSFGAPRNCEGTGLRVNLEPFDVARGDEHAVGSLPHRFFHEVGPDGKGAFAARNTDAARFVEAEPHDGHEFGREAHEPKIALVVGRPGLARDGAFEVHAPQAARSAAIHDAFEQGHAEVREPGVENLFEFEVPLFEGSVCGSYVFESMGRGSDAAARDSFHQGPYSAEY